MVVEKSKDKKSDELILACNNFKKSFATISQSVVMIQGCMEDVSILHDLIKECEKNNQSFQAKKLKTLTSDASLINKIAKDEEGKEELNNIIDSYIREDNHQKLAKMYQQNNQINIQR